MAERFALTCEIVPAGPDETSQIDWFAPFGLAGDVLLRDVLPQVIGKGNIVSGAAIAKRNRPLPLGPDEPAAALVSFFGVMCLVHYGEGEGEAIAFWPTLKRGVQHPVMVRRLRLSANRLEALVEGSVGPLDLCYQDQTFAADRGFYAEGIVHHALLLGIAHVFAVIDPRPIRIRPEDAGYAVFAGAKATGADGTIRIATKGRSAFRRHGDAVCNLYDLRGPVTAVEEHHPGMMGVRVWLVRVIAARLAGDQPFEIEVLVTEPMLTGTHLPKVGDDVIARVLLAGSIWTAVP